LSLGFDSRKHEALLTHLHRKEKLAFAVRPGPLPVPMAQNMFRRPETLPAQRRPKFVLSTLDLSHDVLNKRTALGILEP
jgi:hypothetical protein